MSNMNIHSIEEKKICLRKGVKCKVTDQDMEMMINMGFTIKHIQNAIASKGIT